MGSIRVARLIANLRLENVTIERRGRKGRKVGQDHSAAFAAFAFQCGSNRLRSEPLHRERFSADSWRNLVALRRLGYAACTNATHAHLAPPLASELPCPTMTRLPLDGGSFRHERLYQVAEKGADLKLKLKS